MIRADTANAAPRPINSMLTGLNLQWVDGGDGLFDRLGRQQAAVVDKLRALNPSSLRFPGGTQSDAYRWQFAMGPLQNRRENLHFQRRQMQPSIMGTQEFLELCELTGAEPFLTVNAVSGTVEEAADWIRTTNRTRLVSRRTGRPLPSVRFWEIGNEPYLKEGDENQRQSPDAYFAKANALIRALRSVDSDVQIGVPIRTPKVAGLPATPYPDFARDLLTKVGEPFDFLSNHNAYMPYLFDRVPDERTIFWGTVGATATVEGNLDETARLAQALRPGWRPVQAITEFNALFSLGKGASDDLVASPLAALYVADLIRMLAQRDDILLAQYWSFSANWKFGAVGIEQGSVYERPNYIVLRMLNPVLRGERCDFSMNCGSFDSPRAGAAAPAARQPLVTCLVTREGRELRILLINKDMDREAGGTIDLGSLRARSGTISTLRYRALRDTADTPGAAVREESALSVDAASPTLALRIGPASVSTLNLVLA